MTQKKLTLSAVKRDDAKLYGVKKQVSVQGYSFIVETVFRNTAITDLSEEFVDDLQFFVEKKVDISMIDMVGYMSLLVIKHFSNFDVPSDPLQKIQTLRLLLDGDFFHGMIGAFDEIEIKKVVDKLEVLIDAMKVGMEKATELIEQERVQEQKVQEDSAKEE